MTLEQIFYHEIIRDKLAATHFGKMAIITNDGIVSYHETQEEAQQASQFLSTDFLIRAVKIDLPRTFNY